ncbi:MAG: AraC family transcriptional regulator of arabinose operon [Cocleimonas sp.]|jgi:AraC family transcriptional regulator of arabinose operon
MVKIEQGFPGQRLVVIPPNIVEIATQDSVCAKLFPTHIGMFQKAIGHYVSRESGVDEIILIGCLVGEGSCHFNHKEWYLKPGNLIAIPANTQHKYKTSDNNPWTIFWIHFKGEMVKDYLQALKINAEEPMINIANISSVIDAFEDIYQHTESGYTNTALFCLSTSFMRFFGVCRLHQRALKTNQQGVEERIKKSVVVMQQNIGRHMRLDELAAISGWSPTHYSALFKNQMNTAPIEFFTRLKMQIACNKLKLTREPIQNIATSLGYKDALYFSRLFKRQNNLSPQNYRREFSLINSKKD